MSRDNYKIKRLGVYGGSISAAGDPLAPGDPVLTWVSGTTDNTPELTITFTDIIPAGSDFTIQYANNSGFTSPTEVVHDLTSPEAAAQAIALALAALADGPWYIRVKCTVDGHDSAWSNTETKTIDAAPTLTSPTGTKTGQTTADLGVTTDQGNGTLYWVVTTAVTPPSAAQVKAGQDHAGAAAAASGSQAIASSGAKTASATGLTQGTTYYAHFMHEDATAHQSSVATSASFTTDATTFSLAFTEGRVEASGGTTITHTAVSFGAADTNRVIAVVATSRMVTVNTITGVTIGGVAAIEVVSARATINGTNGSTGSIWYASVPSGTSGNIVVTHGAAAARTGISAFRIVTLTPAPTSANNAISASPLSAAITVPSGGAGIAGHWQNAAVTDVTWTNSTSAYEANAGGSSRLEAATVSTIGAVSPTATGGNAAATISAAAWGP